jgi:hypothetical protein
LPLNLPRRGDRDWDTPLNAALNDLDSRITNFPVTTPGTWNPQFKDSTNTLAGITQTGNYTAIGKMVFFCINVSFTGYTNLGTGQYEFTLPFPAKQTFTARGGTLHNPTTDARYHLAAIVDLIADGPSAKAKLYYTGSTTDLAWKSTTPVNWAAQTAHFDMSGFYEKA